MVIEYPVPPGTVVKERIKNRDEEQRTIEWVFEEQYDHHALFRNKWGTRRCFTNAELYTRGIVVPRMQ